MNLGDLIQEFRIEADDNQDPPLFSENEARTWANQGYKEVCRRTHELTDSTTTSICQITTVPGQAEYAIDPKVIFILRVANTSKSNRILPPVKFETMDMFEHNWESRTGEPKAYVVGMNNRKITLTPTPTEAHVLKVSVARLPLVDLESPSDVPEIKEEYHQGIVNWMLYRGFSKKDAEVEDKELARAALRAFEEEFGTREQANAALEVMRLKQTYHPNSGAY